MLNDTVRLSIDIPNNYHKALKFYTLNHDTTIKDFFIDLLEKNMPEEMEDHILGKMATDSRKKGSLGKAGSQKFLKNLKTKIKNHK